MNTPLLFWASQTSGDQRYASAARRHTAQLRDHILRPDGTTFHTFYWDSETGEPLRGRDRTGQLRRLVLGPRTGLGHLRIRAQPPVHRRRVASCTAALRCADYFLAHLPADHVAYWDLEFSEGSGEERDSSAAAIAASGLLELADALSAGPRAAYYRAAANRILTSLIDNYSTRYQPRSNALILHGVYDKPKGVGVDEGNLWGDYFYLEALTRVTRSDWISHW